ncbi:MAG: endolytic transglycosylase MltG [Actinobacteria bacterium]|nr:endolytic transglycosylase MltG [Actinomycetota bacterium]
MNPEEIKWQEDSWDGPDAWGSSDFEQDIVENRPDPRIVLIVLAVVMSLIVAVGAIGIWYLRQLNPPDLVGAGGQSATNFTVNPNDSLVAVSERLQNEGFIVNAGVFRWYVARNGGIDLQPGYYQLIPRSHVGDIMKVLNTSPSMTFTKVTFPEGFTVAKIAARLGEKIPRISAEDFLATAANPDFVSLFGPADPGRTDGAPFRLEGLLFPDTYQISGDEGAASIVDRMLRLMERVGRQEGIEESTTKVGRSPYEVLIIASLIEREAKLEVDRAKIARVIYNRLERGMPLQVDATLYYNAAEGVSFSDLMATDSQYNSYLYKGLPPTPIANPGRAAIRAALNPAPNPPLSDPICKGIKQASRCAYIYYVLSDANGGHTFAATLQDHEKNVEAARQAGVLP